MPVLTAAQTTRLSMMAGEYRKAAGNRMLSDEDLDLIASDVALVPDDEDRTPIDEDYVTTVDLYRAAAEAWRMKAGIVAEDYDFIAEGGEFKRSQVYAACLKQAARYAGMAESLTLDTRA